MSRLTTFALALVAMLVSSLAATGTASAQAACFFEHADFQGRSFCVEEGRDVSALGPGTNDSFSSIQIASGIAVTACEHIHFQGQCITFSQSVRNFGGFWNDRISSFRVSAGGWQHPTRPRYTEPRGDGWGFVDRPQRLPRPVPGAALDDHAPPRDRVCFFLETNFQGQPICAPSGAQVTNLERRGANDAFASVVVPEGMSVIACEHAHFGGECIRLDRSARYLGDRWAYRISSFRVEGW